MDDFLNIFLAILIGLGGIALVVLLCAIIREVLKED